MAAAPHLFDDPRITSPELALVDAELAAELRADLSSGEAFRPREAARPAYLSLVFDSVAPDPAPQDMSSVDERQELPVDVVDVVPAYVVLADDAEVVPDDDSVTDVAEDVAEPVLPAPDEPADEPDLQGYIVRETVVEVVPEYVVVADEQGADDVVPAEVVAEVVDDASRHSTQANSDYPVLPDLDERSEALEETEAALRKIREQMGGGASTPRRKRRFRRRFTVATGLCAVMALAVYAAEVELGVTHAPGWLSF